MGNASKNSNSKIACFTRIQFFYGATCAAYFPFIVFFLISKGYDSITIGTILAINSFVFVFALPFWGIMSDRFQSVKKVLIICIAVSGCIFLSLPFYGSALIIGMALALLTFFEGPVWSLQDSWVIQEIKSEKNIAYGNIRLWGSLGFAITAYAVGRTVEATSVYIIFPAYALFALITLIITVKIKTGKSAAPISLSNLKVGRLIKNYRYVVFLLFAIVLFAPLRGAMFFLPLLIEEVGGTGGDIGRAIFVAAIVEVPIFLLSRCLITKFKPVHLIFFSTVFFMLIQILFAQANTPLEVILLHILQGPSFALFLTGAVYYIDSLAPQELRATAQTVAAAVFFGGSGIMGSLGGGWIIDNFSLTQMYQAGAIITLCVSVMFILSFFIKGKILAREGC